MRHGRPSNRRRQESPSLESLELRLLLTQTPLAITAPRDAVFDPSRGLLYVTTGSGSVQRYDLATGTFLAPWSVGTSLNGADITPDGSALYVAEGQQTADSKCVVHKVDLATGHVTDLTFAHVDAYEQGTSDVAIAADGNAYVTIDWYSSYHTGSLAVIDMASGVVTRSNRLFDEYHTDIARSADRTRLAVGRPSAGVRVFNVLTQTVTANGYGSYQASYNGEASVSRDGRLIATPALNFGMSIVTDAGAPITNLAPELGISAFDPAHDRFYVALSTGVTAYDTNTWKSIYTVPARILGGGYSPIGRMTVDAGGTRLAVVSPSDNQVELIDLPVPDGVAAKLEMAGYPPLAITGRPETFTVTVRDAAGNVATGYRGTVSFGTADVAATLPAPYTFTAQDAGTKTFSLTFRTPTYQTITVTDAAAGLTAPKSVISVHRPSPFQTLDNLSPTGTYDPVHRLLYLADYGGVRRYDPVAQRMLPTIDLDGFPATTLDVTPDGRYLYLGTSYRSMNNGWLLRVDLDTLAIARLPFALQRDDEAGIRSLAVASNGRVIFNTSADSANSYGYVRDYDPATGTFTLRLDILFNASLEKRSVLSRSADHGVVFIGDAYGNSRGVYDAATNHITYYSINSTTGPYASLNHDGSLIASFGNLVDHGLNPVRTFGTDVITSGFDPTRPRLYALEPASGLVAYDTDTWAKLFTVPVAVANINDGLTRVAVSEDGRWLFYSSGVMQVIPLFTRPVIASAAPPIITPGTSFPVTVTAQAPGGTTDAAYLGTLHFSSTDPAATLPPDTAYVAGDLGLKTFSVTLNTPGRHTVTATDPATGASTVLYDVLVSGIALDAEGTLAVMTTDANDTISLSTGIGGAVTLVVKGAPGIVYPAGSVRRIDFLTRGGNDVVTLTGVSGGNVDLGAGFNYLDVTAGDDGGRGLFVTGGDNDDTAVIHAAGAEPITFFGGNGADGVTLYGTAGDDKVSLTGLSTTVGLTTLAISSVESFTVSAGAGDDRVTGFASTSATLATTIDGGDGNDAFLISGGGSADTTVRRVSVLGGNGNDQLTVLPNSGGVMAYNYLAFVGGAGVDAITFYGENQYDIYTVSATALICHNNSTTYSGTEQITVNGNDLADTVTISAGTSALPPLVVNGLAGNDTFILNSGPTVGYPMFLGGAGDDRLSISASSTGAAGFDGGDGTDSVAWTTANTASSVLADAAGISGGGRQVFASNWESATITGGTGADAIRVTPSAAVAFTVAAGSPTTGPGDKLTIDPVGAGGIVLTPGATGAGSYAFSNRKPVVYTGVETLVLLPAIGPVAYEAGAPRRLSLPFSVDVGASLAAGDFHLVNRATGSAMAVALSYDATARVATLTFPTMPAGLPDGNYRLTVAAADVTDSTGTPMSTGLTYDLFALAGDANQDRTVDFLDLAKLAQNYNTGGSGKTYADGDFNGDGNVDFLDLAILAQRYNTSLPVSGAAQPVAASSSTSFAADWAAATVGITAPVTTTTDTKKVKPKPVFSVTPVVKPVPVKSKAPPQRRR